jgi:hypothetical protein|tara:strand:+ start:23735 stop:23926 length:192 start_codon:yes stop_codon:yes gene_type:complete
MQATQKKRFSVSLDVEDYAALKSIADAQKPPLSLQYLVSYALNEFIDSHKDKQVEFNFEGRKR